jgi:PTS system nitrogen regulatory IIA component
MIERIIQPSITYFDAPGSSKKRALENVANFISEQISGIDSEELFEQLTARERLGSTAVGKGMAIPHCRNAHISQSVICPVKLKQAIDFDANDGQQVDILFVLLVPEDCNDEHLQILSELAQLIDEAEFRNQLRKADSRETLYQAATSFSKAA